MSWRPGARRTASRVGDVEESLANAGAVLMGAGTTFTFVTAGIEAALAQAREVAGGGDVVIAGGAETARQYLAAGVVDEMTLSVVPPLLGGGARLLDGPGVANLDLEQVRVIGAPRVTHLTYRIRRPT